MNFPRVVYGFHGCLEPLATELLTGRMAIADWPVSRNKWDWLGEGIYFWEHGPARALKWAEEKARRANTKGRGGAVPAVVGAVISLGTDDVLDLTDIAFSRALNGAYQLTKSAHEAMGAQMPVNETSNPKRHNLDCLVINSLFALADVQDRFNVVRGLFEEGDPVFPGSTIREETHIQLAVRKPGVIRGLFRPSF
jgi:hypothetical protein